jgi:predicted regulator of Ras-like GTPase activity (Roadblock/LC7/MglB family)
VTVRSFTHAAEVGGLLEGLVLETHSVTALLISREGICLSKAGLTESLNSTALAALVAGMFAATREVANIVGEEHFSILLQQGEKRNIHISLIGDRFMLVVVFEDNSRIGLVRMSTRRISSELQAILLRKPDESAEAAREALSMPAFREYAMNLVDQIFSVGAGEGSESTGTGKDGTDRNP